MNRVEPQERKEGDRRIEELPPFKYLKVADLAFFVVIFVAVLLMGPPLHESGGEMALTGEELAEEEGEVGAIGSHLARIGGAFQFFFPDGFTWGGYAKATLWALLIPAYNGLVRWHSDWRRRREATGAREESAREGLSQRP